MISMTIKIPYLLCIVLSLFSVAFSEENEKNSGPLSVERIFKNKEFSSKGFLLVGLMMVVSTYT